MLQMIDGRIKTSQELYNLCGALFSFAEQALRFRQTGTVERLTNTLAWVPLPRELDIINKYYNGMAAFYGGDTVKRCPLLEAVAETQEAPLLFRARAISGLGNRYLTHDVDLQSAKCLFEEAGRIAKRLHNGRICDPLSIIQVHRNITIIISVEGDHRTALARLLSIRNLVESLRAIYPHEYYAYQNSLAVELAEVGQLDAAEHCINIALASPFAPYYDGWLETRGEIKEKRERRLSHSAVTFCRLEKAMPNNVQALPVQYHAADEVPIITNDVPAKILGMGEYLNTRMDDKQTKKKPADQRSRKDKLKEVYDRMVDYPPTEGQLDRMLEILQQKENSDAEEK